MSSKRQTTMAKLTRERKVAEKRARKQEKKQALRDERKNAAENPLSGDVTPDEGIAEDASVEDDGEASNELPALRREGDTPT
jgi:hypothetical protein